jgi:hypothetical protein
MSEKITTPPSLIKWDHLPLHVNPQEVEASLRERGVVGFFVSKSSLTYPLQDGQVGEVASLHKNLLVKAFNEEIGSRNFSVAVLNWRVKEDDSSYMIFSRKGLSAGVFSSLLKAAITNANRVLEEDKKPLIPQFNG